MSGEGTKKRREKGREGKEEGRRDGRKVDGREMEWKKGE